MKNLISFIVRFHFTILFIFLEVICVALLVRNNNYQKAKFLNSSNALSGGIYNSVSSIGDYLSLARVNEELAKENARLHNLLEESYKLSVDSSFRFVDTLYQQQYVYRWARVINNSVNKQLNYVTINKGSLQGITPEMAVVTDKGIVGMVLSVSQNYSTVISLLNHRLNISAKIRKNNYYGPLSWDGKDYRKVKLSHIPSHVVVSRGDTIVTSGYSSIFPEGKVIGTVSEVKSTTGGNFHDISVDLSIDFRQLSYVQVVGDLLKEERLELENNVLEK
ncbi:MAG: rod shape-determining protein MreC [Marinifilaceae bacterium]|jgi:rod shape-determining protein MreC